MSTTEDGTRDEESRVVPEQSELAALTEECRAIFCPTEMGPHPRTPRCTAWHDQQVARLGAKGAAVEPRENQG
jgi:hypothetical protein